MNAPPEAAADGERYRRKLLDRTEPRRGAGQLYRSAEGPGTALGGVPLSSAEDAVVAAVRMGYQVAQAHVDRAGRIGKRLRSAGERAVGAEPERQAVDATERLVGKALLSGLEWLEGVAAEPGSPLRRYATAQYKLLGAMLGLHIESDAAGGAPPPHPEVAQPEAAAAPRPDVEHGLSRRMVSVVHRGGAMRAVKVHALQLDVPRAEGTFELVFYGAAASARSTFAATLVLDPGRPAVLQITTAARSPAGLWKAAACAPDGEQLGWIEIEL